MRGWSVWISGDGGKGSESGYILKVEPTGFKNGLTIGCKKLPVGNPGGIVFLKM